MTDQVGFVTYYFWEGNRVVKSEKFASQNLVQRIEYGYDDAGNVGEMVYYDRQPDGTMQRSIVFIFLYYNDGNVYKKMTYHVQEDQELVLSSTQTFENYLMKPNPVPMVETLPHLNSQPNLPQSYRYEIHDTAVEYQMQYRFRADGLLLQRTVADGKGTTETTNYTYH
jgi:predicted GNAT family acetyltransferase